MPSRKLSECAKLQKPLDGYETESEINAVLNHGRDDFIRYKILMKHQLARSKNPDEVAKADHKETAQAYKEYLNTLESLTTLHTTVDGNEQHQLYGRYIEVLGEYRQEKQKLKQYGRWDWLFSKNKGLIYSPEKKSFE